MHLKIFVAKRRKAEHLAHSALRRRLLARIPFASVPAPVASVVFVSGASGVLGSRLVRTLVDSGWAVRALVQPGDPFRSRLDGLPCDIREGDLARPGSLRGLLDGVTTAFHLAAIILSPDPDAFERVNRLGTAQLVSEAARAGVEHVVYVSSASVTYPRLTRYAQSKLAGEALLKAETRLRHTIVRPTLVYDENGGQEFMMFWRYLERFPLVPFVGDGRARKRPVWAGDIVDGLRRIAGNPRSHGRTYNFSGGESVTIQELAEMMLARHGEKKRFLHLPVPLCQAGALVLGLLMRDPPLSLQAIAGLVNDADLPPDEATRDLGYVPLGVREGLVRCFPLRATTLSSRPERQELVS
jgi:nucleoside-diphosphate-sugar epimerase